MMVKKVISTSKPAYLARRLQVNNQDRDKVQGTITAASHILTITRGGFIVRGTQLFNSLPPPLRTEPDLKKFRGTLRTWVEQNIPAKPL